MLVEAFSEMLTKEENYTMNVDKSLRLSTNGKKSQTKATTIIITNPKENKQKKKQ